MDNASSSHAMTKPDLMSNNHSRGSVGIAAAVAATKEIEEKLPKILAFAEVNEFAEAPFGSYSAGMRARINFAISVLANPDLLIIDEGLAVSDVRFREKSVNTLKEISQNMGVLLVSHNMEQFQKLATRMIVMEKGKIVMDTVDVQKAIDHALKEKND